MKNILTSLFFLAFAACLFGQPINVSTPDAMTKAAEQAITEGNPYEAMEYYAKVDKESKDKAIDAKLAELYYELRLYEKAERKLRSLVVRDRKKEWTEYKYLYAMTLKAQGNYADAMGYFEDYALEGLDEANVKRAKLEIEGIKMAKGMKAPDNLVIGDLGKNVNSPQTESSPTFSEGNLYYSSINQKDVIEIKDGAEWEAKIYSTSRGMEGFGDPTPLGQEINREGYHQGNVFVTEDGKVMYFTRNLLEAHRVVESKIYYSRNSGGTWGAANEVAGVNGDYLAKHPTMGELYGEKVMFFIANIPGGQGGDDIYYAPRREDGLFGAPVSLGEGINTPGDEASPFYNDGKLYFSSNGYPSLGGYDVFVSTWNGSVWSKPSNMGLGINTAQDDLYFTTSKDAKSGFLVSNRAGGQKLKGEFCCDDIYEWELEQIKVTLNALTYRFKTSKEKKLKENPPLEGCTVQLFDVTDKSPERTDTRTNPNGNEFQFSLFPEKEYNVIISRDGYQNDTLTFNTVGVTKSKTVEKKVTLRRERPTKPTTPEPPASDSIVVTRNEAIRLNNIYYDFDDDKILQDAEQDLYVIYDLMNQYPDMVIELASHTDAQGKDDYNEKLSQRRADSARRWLLEKGVAAERIVAKGYGETQILNECVNGVKCDDDQHRFNRRTEFKIIAGPTEIVIKKMEVRPRSGAGNSWNSLIYDILQDAGYFNRDTVAPKGMFEDVFEKEEAPFQRQAPATVRPDPAAAQNVAKAAPTDQLVQVSEAAQSRIMGGSMQQQAPVPVAKVETAAATEWQNPADAVMVFNQKSVDFGEIVAGEKVEQLFSFTNTGEEALVIEIASACDCMQLDYTRTLVEKGETGSIQAIFDSSEQYGNIEKTIDVIFGNTDKDGYPLIQQLKVTGTVK